MVLICAIIVLVIGLGFIFEIAPRYIKSIRELSEAEQIKVNLHRVYMNVGIVIIMLSMLLFVAHFNPIFKEKYLFLGTLIWCAICVLDTVYMQKSSRYFKV